MKQDTNPTQIAFNNIRDFFHNYEKEIRSDELRTKVVKLVPAIKLLRNLGQSLAPVSSELSARDRILFYFQKYPQTVISGDEILLISGIQEYARRIRELRNDFGWHILSGATALEYSSVEYSEDSYELLSQMKPSDYILTSTIQNKKTAYLNNIARQMRNAPSKGARQKILDFLFANVGEEISGETLRYVSGDSKEWARRVRELRTEFGYDIRTKQSGRPDLDVGVYVLESKKQGELRMREVPTKLKKLVLARDGDTCTNCGWAGSKNVPGDFRILEIHHIKPLNKGGANALENLVTLCNRCHDKVHAYNK